MERVYRKLTNGYKRLVCKEENFQIILLGVGMILDLCYVSCEGSDNQYLILNLKNFCFFFFFVKKYK